VNIEIVALPYDSGYRGLRMGAGPPRFIESGIDNVLREAGHDVHIQVIETQAEFHPEVGTAFELNRALATSVRKAVERGNFPLILSGNCIACLGAMSGLATPDTGLIWLDAHGDFNTPETSTSGFLDGMGLAVVVGRCWQALARTVPGYAPLAEESVVHIGGRDFDRLEKQLLEQSGVGLVEASAVHQSGLADTINPALGTLRERVERVYIHFDFDVLDPALYRANQFAAPDGLKVEQVESIFQKIADQFTIAGIGFSAYDPAYDSGDKMLQTGFQLMKSILALQ
jgi:arginase